MTNSDDHADRTPSGLRRRDFLGSLAAAPLLALGAGAPALAQTGAAPTERAPRPASDTRRLGPLEVSPIGLGCMSMTSGSYSGSYNPPRPAEEMIPVIRGAVDRGVTFFDTAT